MAAPGTKRAEIINDFLASTLIFSTAMTDLIDEQARRVIGKSFTMPQLKLLKLVARTEAGTISDVATFLGVSNAAASKAVDRLVRRGLIERKESADDRRAIHLSLSDDGKRILERYEEIQLKTLDGLFRQFMPQDFIDAGELLDRLSLDLVGASSRPDELCFRCGIYFRDKCLLRDATKRTCYHHLHKLRQKQRKSSAQG
jgi:DNA-binding MarR family transcriptional regulator